MYEFSIMFINNENKKNNDSIFNQLIWMDQY